MRFETVSPIEFVKRCRHLFDQTYAEAAILGRGFDLSEEAYALYEEHTPSFAIIAYDGDDVVGYVSVFMNIHQHTKVPMATNDVIYVLPKLRGGVLAGKLFFCAEREARSRGAMAFQWIVPVRSPLYKALLARTPVEERPWCQVAFLRNFHD